MTMRLSPGLCAGLVLCCLTAAAPAAGGARVSLAGRPNPAAACGTRGGKGTGRPSYDPESAIRHRMATAGGGTGRFGRRRRHGSSFPSFRIVYERKTSHPPNASQVHIRLVFNGGARPAGVCARRQVDRNGGARERWPPFPRRFTSRCPNSPPPSSFWSTRFACRRRSAARRRRPGRRPCGMNVVSQAITSANSSSRFARASASPPPFSAEHACSAVANSPTSSISHMKVPAVPRAASVFRYRSRINAWNAATVSGEVLITAQDTNCRGRPPISTAPPAP